MTADSSAYDALDPAALRRRGTMKWNRYDPDVLALWVAEMDYPTAPSVLAAIRAAVEREEFGYPRATADAELGQALAKWTMDRYGWAVDVEHVHALPDVLKGVELGIEHFSPPGSAVVLPTPAYMPFFEVPKVVDRPIVEVPMLRKASGFCFDFDGIEQAFAAGARTLILCQPYNPLGRCFTREELVTLATIVERHGCRVVSDEIHSPLTYGGNHVPYATSCPEAATHSITLTSASKAWSLPGLRCAVAVTTNDADENRWKQISPLKTHGASTIGIAASIAAYATGAEWLAGTIDYLDRNRLLLRDLLAERMPEVHYIVPEGTYLAWLDFSELALPRQPAEFFLERARVAMNPGISFGRQAGACARLNFATTSAILERAVDAMADAIRTR